MAIPRKLWSALKPATQKRKLSFYRKQGLSDQQIRSRYNSGSLGPQTAARGHAETPERPSRAAKNPQRYRKYLRKRHGGGPGPFATLRDRAYNNFYRHLGGYIKYNDDTVRRHVYTMMTDDEARWTEHASEEDLLHYATVAMHHRLFQTAEQSPWWYH